MIRFRYFNIVLPALLALAACSDDDGLTSGNGQGEVRITTHISGAQTRAPQLGIDGSGNFEKGDALNLAVYGEGATPYTPDYLVETTTLYWEDIKNATGLNEFYTFAGWYSEDKTLKLQDNNSFSFNVAEAATDEQKDLLLATPTEVNEGDPVNMIFRHAMHKLVVNLSYGEGFDNVDKSAITVKPVGMNAAATIDVKAGTVTVGEASADKGTYPAKKVGDANSCSFILAPQKLEADADWLEIKLAENQTVIFKVPEQFVDGNTGTAVSLTQLNSGETLTLNLTIKRTNINEIAIELTGCTITDWTDGGSYDENVPIPDTRVPIYVNLAELTEEYVINDGEYYVFSGSSSYGIKVMGGNPDIRLENAQISVSSGNAIDIQRGNPTIHVTGKDNKVSTDLGAGIYVAENYTVTITGNSQEDAITVTGGGTDNGHGVGAGIGGYHDQANSISNSCGNIHISNVTITAKGSRDGVASNTGSGIGSVGPTTVGSINISSAIVYAEGGVHVRGYYAAAAIGGAHSTQGWGQTEFDITISNSTIHATQTCAYASYIGAGGDPTTNPNYDIISTARITDSTIYKYTDDSSSSVGSVYYDANGNRTDQ